MKLPNEREVAQNLAHTRDLLPRLWWAIYQGCLQVGFSESQSVNLLHAYILSQNPNGIQPSGGAGPNSDSE